MQIQCVDLQVVTSSDTTMFSLIGQGATNALILMTNVGSNTLVYHFQQLIVSSGGATWTDLVASPDGYFTSTIVPGQTVGIQLNNSNPQIQLMALASGGSTLWFSVDRFFTRSSGGPLPLLNY